MDNINIKIKAEADFLTHKGKTKNVSFYRIRSYYISNRLCTDCHNKSKDKKAYYPQNGHLTENDICKQCIKELYLITWKGVYEYGI